MKLVMNGLTASQKLVDGKVKLFVLEEELLIVANVIKKKLNNCEDKSIYFPFPFLLTHTALT